MIDSARLALSTVRGLEAIRSAVSPRGFRAFCVGAPKSGTRSLAGYFERDYRARHEPAVAPLLELAEGPAGRRLASISDRGERAAALRSAVEKLRRHSANGARAELVIRWRDLRKWLEFESSFAASIVLEILVRSFEDARFVLTLRHPRDWLESQFNAAPILARMSTWQRRWADMWFGWDRFEFSAGESVLASHGLYTLDGYLSFWRDHNLRVLNQVPPERLLVLRTDQIGKSAGNLAAFVGVPVGSLDAASGHLNATRSKAGLVEQLDQESLALKVEHYCGDLLARYFQDWEEPVS